MKLTAEQLRDGCQWLSRELTRLEQLNRPLSIDEFFDLSEGEKFINTMFEKYGHFILGLHLLDHRSEHCNKELIAYMENALSRYSNVITRDTYGVVDNAYLLAINVLFDISREADEM
ncbi:hypothetical protein K5I76_003840 [Salmonella enterica]|nr:hypothetical protein [Salmonella enterica]ECG0831280.1 hypothetical protein [Salmonella enterica subsp. diarizonae]HCM1903681.1 hypothetical protein [Salmonella enterica subsp. diarizonae serovar 61:z52:z53]EAP3484773.1 hypothetical protein [Salmonella enterica]EBD6773410.1 hypothetical protein [Salmonella enterica]